MGWTQSIHRGLIVLAALIFMALPAGGISKAAQALAPQALRCPGRTLPSPPERWRWEWSWEVPDSYSFPGPFGDDGPYAVALDQCCNLYVAELQNHQVVKLYPGGDELARWTAPRVCQSVTCSLRCIAAD